MWISEISIKRPVLAIVISAVLVLFGLMGLSRLSVREYPDIDPPIVSVNTIYTGASPEVIESTITEPLEDELTSIEGIKTLSSSSQEQVSRITIEFELSRDIDAAAQDVRDHIARVRRRLPDDIEEPVVVKQDADAQPILWLSLYGKNFTPLQISDYADRYIVDQLQTLPGVARVIIGGQREYSMRLWLDPTRMAARQVTALDVQKALETENVEIPSGRIEGVNREFTVRTLGELHRPDEFNRLIIKNVDNVPVYLQDIGWAEVGAKSDRSLVRFNGLPAVGLGIVKQSKANTLDVAHAVKAKLPDIRKTLPHGLQMQAAFDTSLFIERSIEEVKESLFVAGALVILVIFAFLRNLRATFIPAISIPVSIVSTFAIMSIMGYSINILTLLGLTLSIGLVVDDTIVVLENIYRHMEMGKPPLQAAYDGTREIGFAILATTFVLVAVFVPVAFMGGTTGRLFVEFAVVVAGSVLISGFVSLSLAPMMCSKLLKNQPSKTMKIPLLAAVLDATNRFLQTWESSYGRGLNWAVRHQRAVFNSVAVLMVFTAIAYVFLPKEFLPLEDRGQVQTIIDAPEGSTLAYTDRALRQAETVYKSLPEVSKFFSVLALSAEGVGAVNNGFLFVTLKPKEERHRKQQDIVSAIIPQMMRISEAFVFPINPPSGPIRGVGKPVNMVLKGFDIQELAEYSAKILKRAQAIPGFITVDSDLKLNKPQLELTVNREKASALGVSVRDISSTLQILLGGLDLSTFQFNSKRYDVMVQVPPALRATPDQLNTIFVNGRNDQLIPLSSVVNYRESVAPKALNHYSRLRSATISGTMLPFTTMGKVIKQLQDIAQEELPPQIQVDWSGDSREFLMAQSAANSAFLIALLIVFLVLSAQFESFIHPMVILLTVPLAVSGAILTLFFVGNSLNVYSQIGIILLIGLVTKNGILIVEYANQQREQDPSLSAMEAVVSAAQIRFRPILMTSIATIFGAIPIALALGAGAESRQPLGVAIVGGLLVATFLTLFLIPVVYERINRNRKVSG